MTHLLEIKMTLKKSTKGTHVYEAPDSDVPTIYIRKSGLPDTPPEEITLRIEVE